ncbi:sodium-dependent dopamine transporter-like [Schistosoma japonicum]|nr:sodium-dependent dopamine transporter-like [Schistosoma japonicum]
MNHNPIDSSTFWQSKSQWNLMQAFLLSSCFISMTMFSKYPLDQYLGSGWAFLSFIIFHAIYNTPITYLQFRVFGHFRESILVLFDRYIPISNIIVILINLIKFIIGTYFLSISFGYLFFTFYNCDGRNCIGGTFVWGSCSDSWSEGDCKDNYKIVHEGPIPEEKFVLNFLLMRSDSILSGWEITSWFTIRGLILIPYLAAFTCIFLITIGGPKVFGIGFLSTFVHLSQSYNLWNGVYPTVGRLMNGGKKMRHLGWLPTVIGSALLGQLPVLIILFAIASSYDPQYVRCHLSVDWLAPFIIIPHIFSKFSSSRLLVASYFLGLSLFLLLNQLIIPLLFLKALILLSTTEHIVGHLITNNEKYEDHYKRVYRGSIIFIILLLGLLGVPLVTQAGFYWIRLIDWFIDRLTLIPVLGQAVGFLIVYAHLRGNKIETPMVKTIIICIYAILITISSGIYIWYAFSSLQKPPDFQCRTYSRAPVNDPIQNNFILLGWLIAFLPILIGVTIGLILTFIRFRTHHTTEYSYFNYLFKGEYGLQKFMQKTVHLSNIQSTTSKYSNMPKTFSWTRINNYDNYNSNKFIKSNVFYPNNLEMNRTIYRSVGEQLGNIMSSSNDITHAYSTNQLPIYHEYNKSINQLNSTQFPVHRKSEVNIYNRSMPNGKEYQYQKGKQHQSCHYSKRYSIGKSDIYESEEFL